MSDELEDILEDLQQDDSVTDLNDPSTDNNTINDENVNAFIMDKMGSLVEEGIGTIQAIQQGIMTGFEPEELQALCSLINSVTNAADTLNKINLQNKKDKTSKELKQMDIEKQTNKQLNQKTGDTNVLIATREEIINRFLDETKKKDIPVEFTEEDEDE